MTKRTNRGGAPFCFSLGAHEAYRTPGGIEDYEILPSGAVKTTYSHGEVMLSNPTASPLAAEGRELEPFSNLVIR